MRQATAEDNTVISRRIIETIVSATLSMIVWLFMLVTVAWVVVVAAELYQSPDTTVALLSVDDGGVAATARGLTFSGAEGAMQASVLAGCVLFALFLSFSSRTILRRLGLLVTLAWAGLWTGNAFWLGSNAGEGGLMTVGFGLAAVMVFTLARTSRLW